MISKSRPPHITENLSQSNHRDKYGSNEGTAGAETTDRSSTAVRATSRGGSCDGLDTKGGASDDLGRAAGGDRGGDGGWHGRSSGRAAARPGTGPGRERSPASGPGSPCIAVDAAGLGAPWSAKGTSWTTVTTMTSPHTGTTPSTLAVPATRSRRETSRASRDPARPLTRVPVATRSKARAGSDLRRPGRATRSCTEGGLLRSGDSRTSIGAKLCNGTEDG